MHSRVGNQPNHQLVCGGGQRVSANETLFTFGSLSAALDSESLGKGILNELTLICGDPPSDKRSIHFLLFQTDNAYFLRL